MDWGLAIAAHGRDGQPKRAFDSWKRMLLEGSRPDRIALAGIARVFSALSLPREAERLHASIIAEMEEIDSVLGNALLNMHKSLRSIDRAEEIFIRIKDKDVVSWTSMAAAFAQNGHCTKALNLYKTMLHEGFRPNHVTFVCVLGACSTADDLHSLHSQIFDAGFSSTPCVANSLITSHSRSGILEVATMVFDDLGKYKNTVSWTAMVCALVRHGFPDRALAMYTEMDSRPDEVTFSSVLDACASLRSLEAGCMIHERICSREFGHGRMIDSSAAVGNAIVHMYGQCGAIDKAAKIFEEMTETRNVVTWTTIIAAMADRDKEGAWSFFRRMELDGVRPNLVTYATILAAASTIFQVRSILSRLDRSNLRDHPPLVAALVNGFAGSSSIEDAASIFEECATSNPLIWNSMIVAYTRARDPARAFHLLARMDHEGVKINAATITSLCGACSSIADGKSLSRRSLDAGFMTDPLLASSLVTMFGRIGSFGDAEAIFARFSAMICGGDDVVVWNSMLSACEANEDHAKTMDYFRKMEQRGIRSNAATLRIALGACSSCDQIEKMYESLEARGVGMDAGIQTRAATMLARLGRIDRASELFAAIGSSPDVVLWNSVLGSLAQHGLMIQAMEAAREMRLEGVEHNDATMALMISGYSHAGLVEQGISFFRKSAEDYHDHVSHRIACSEDEQILCLVDLMERSSPHN